jgi:hypothetical protein
MVLNVAHGMIAMSSEFMHVRLLRPNRDLHDCGKFQWYLQAYRVYTHARTVRSPSYAYADVNIVLRQLNG